MGEMILVVDDNVESVTLIGLMLERRGFQITAASSGKEALAKAVSEHPSVIILDVMMPDMDGFEVCRRLRANPETADIPVLMLTAKTNVKDKVAGFQAGADDYMVKPIHPDELASRVAVVMQRSAHTNAATEASRARVIGLLGVKGGVGITTLAIDLATTLATGIAQGKRIVVAEMRSGLASAALQLGLEQQKGWVELLRMPVENIDQSLVESQMMLHKSGILLFCGQMEPPGVALPLHRAHAQAVFEQLVSHADYVLLDLGTGLEETNCFLISRCDSVIVGVNPNQAAVAMGASLLTAMAKSTGFASYRLNIVLVNRTPSASGYSREAVEAALHTDLVGFVPPAAELAFKAESLGIPMVVMQPTSVYALQVRAIAERIHENLSKAAHTG